MRIAAHVFRRGAVYTWRRRIPKTYGTKRKNRYIQVSLKTRDPALARRLGAILHGESARVFEDMAASRLTPEQAKLWLEHVVDAELERIRVMRLDAMDSSDPDRQADDRRADELAAHAYRLLAQRGRSAQFDPEADQGLADRGFSEEELRRGRVQIDLLKRDFWHNSQHAKIRNAAGTVLGLETMPAVLYEELRKLKLEGRGAAYAASLTDNPDTPFNELVAAVSAELLRRRTAANDFFEVAGRTRLPGNADSTHVSDLEPGTPEPANAASPKIARPNDTNANPEKRTANPHSPTLAACTEHLVKNLRQREVKEKTIEQARQIMALFEEITEVSDVRQLEQHHLGTFVDALKELPKSYRKSPKDKDKPISYFRELGKSLPPEKVGLAPNTINRNINFVQTALQEAARRGLIRLSDYDFSTQRVKRGKRSRDLRRGFTSEDVQKIFQNPIWTGFKSLHFTRRPGNVLLKDGLFWVPIICALTGARRSEIAGLATSDIVQVMGIWCFDIKENGLRSLKNEETSRLVPIHSQLIELGFLEYVAAQKRSIELFPDMKPLQSETSYGESIDHLFRLAMKDQLTDTVDKSFHSFRHHISTFLTNEADVKDSWRDVILGHKGKSTGEVFYNDGIYMNNLRSVTERIPRIQALDECIKGLSKGENGRSKIRVLPATTSRRKPRSRKIKLSD